MRESLAHAIHSSDLEQHEHDCALDKIHALGLVAANNELGATAIRFIDGQQPKSYQQLIYLLAKKASIKFKCSRDILNKICAQVVRESVFPFCRSCDGRKEIRNEEKVYICPVCNGSGFHKHTDMERSRAIGIELDSYEKAWAKKYQIVQGVFNTHYGDALRDARHRVKNNT